LFECTLRRINDVGHKQRAHDAIRAEASTLVDVSHRIHALAELSFQEHESSAVLRDALRKYGYDIADVDGMPTAFVASHGSGDLTVAICLEYDALPEVGHACGHNVIAAAGLGAAGALAEYDGVRTLVIGCPAEEDGGGKQLLIDRGVFDGVDAALMIHPHSIERDAMATLALGEYRIDFSGPCAEDAVSLLHLGVGQLRERMRSNERVHGIASSATSAGWTIRAETLEDLERLRDMLTAIVEGAALMTSSTFTMTPTSPEYADMRTDDILASLWRENALQLGRTSLPQQDTDAYASTDMGNVSHVVRSIHPLLLVDETSTIHQRAFVYASVSPAGDRAVIDGAILLAWAVIDFAESVH
jgi:metal-dependent amidase/aminoacylase/carboxypeptidase family protein